jgi:hypothetical protein
MADATYQPAVYRKQGGDELVVASSGILTVESGGEIEMETGSSMTFASGSGLALASGSSFKLGTAMEIASGGSIALASGAALTIASGAYQTVPVQTLAKAAVATPVTAFGISALEATTTGPTYTMEAPTAAGQVKFITMYASSTGATHRLRLYSGSSGKPILSFASPSSQNMVTMATSIGPYHFGMVSLSSTSWRIFSMNTVEPITLSHSTTA